MTRIPLAALGAALLLAVPPTAAVAVAADLADRLAVVTAQQAVLAARRADGGDLPFYVAAADTKYAPDQMPCALKYVILNNTSAALDLLRFEATAHGRDGAKLDLLAVQYRYVDPGQFDSAQALAAVPCHRIRTVRVRRVSCAMLDRSFPDCAASLPDAFHYPWVETYGRLTWPNPD